MEKQKRKKTDKNEYCVNSFLVERAFLEGKSNMVYLKTENCRKLKFVEVRFQIYQMFLRKN